MDLTKSEISCLGIFATFIFFWSFILVPAFQRMIQTAPDPNPLIFYPLFNLMYLLLFSFLIYVLLLTLGKGRLSLEEAILSAFKYGMAGFILLWIIPDLVCPPYLVTFKGELLRAHPLWPTVSDSFFYTLLESFSVPHALMYPMLYWIIPILMFLVVLLLISPRQLAKIVKGL